jgi:hypothetical protein
MFFSMAAPTLECARFSLFSACFHQKCGRAEKWAHPHIW